MSQNTAPIFTQTPRIGIGNIVANTISAGAFSMHTGNSASLFIAGPSGSYVNKIRFKPSGSTAATVIRVFVNNGGATTTPANNTLFGEISMPAITTSTTLAQNDFEIPMNIALPANWRLFAIHLGTHTAGTGFRVTTIAGDY
jgi:hypothetical protein